MSAEKLRIGPRGWGMWTDRAMCEDTLITALRGGDGGSLTPMSRGHAEVPEGQPASWHVKVVDKASVRGNIYIGIETCDAEGTHATVLGKDWYDAACVGRALYYRFLFLPLPLFISSLSTSR